MASRDSETQSVLNSIRRIVQALRVSSRAAERRYGLSLAQLFVLQQLADAESLSLNELAERTFTHQSSVSVVVSRLVRRKLVVRARSQQDRRRKQVALSPKGRAILTRAPVVPQEALIATIGKLPAGDLRRLAGLLEGVVHQAGLADNPAALMFDDLAGSRRRQPA
jgi:DNA-binding MarR family transcriptional regulator